MRLPLLALGLVLSACQVLFPLGDVPDGPPPEDAPPPPPDVIAPIDVGLVLHLTFDEPILNTDELGHQVECLGACGQQTDDPHSGNGALAFAGQCLSVASATDLVPTTLSITLWARQATPPPNAETLIARMNGEALPAAFVITSDSSNWSFTVANVTSGDSTSSDGQWHHVAVVFSGAAMTVFLDGEPTSGPLQTTPPSYPVNDPITIGCRTTATGPEQHFLGDLDDVRIYKRTLTAAEIGVLATR